VTHSLDRLLTALYAAPARPEMSDVFLKEFGTVSGVNKAALIAHDIPKNDHRMLAALGDCIKDRDHIRLYEDVYCKFDEWTVRFPKGTEIGKVVQGEDIWPSRELLRSTFYNEFLKEVDVCHMACVGVAGPPGVFEGLSIYRGPREDEFDREQLSALELVTPHSTDCPLYPQKAVGTGVESLRPGVRAGSPPYCSGAGRCDRQGLIR
jgi:hypothetical protein